MKDKIISYFYVEAVGHTYYAVVRTKTYSSVANTPQRQPYCSPSCALSHSGQIQFSTKPLYDPKILQLLDKCIRYTLCSFTGKSQ